MTFCGDLPFVPSGINHHPFENLRRKGHHCHGRKRLSGADHKSFCRLLGKNFCGMCISPWTGGDGCGCLCPRRQGLKRVQGTGYNNGQAPAATTKSACAKRRCPSHPGGLLPGCRERRSRRDRGGATGTVAASRGFGVRDGSPPGRRQLRWLRSRQPAPPGGRPEKAQAGEQQN